MILLGSGFAGETMCDGVETAVALVMLEEPG